MSYKFEKGEWYRNEKRLLELSIEALKLCIDENTVFMEAADHEITHSCTHCIGSKDLIHSLREDIIITKEFFEDVKEINSYNVYILDENADDKWYLVSYLCNDTAGNSIYIDDLHSIEFNIHENYIAYVNNDIYHGTEAINMSMPFTKDEYFNHSMYLDFEIDYQLIKDTLDFKAPEGFNINFYNY